MQIVPSSGGWTNAAASSQHAISDAKHANASTHLPADDAAVSRLEQSGKTSDRDPNERYDGPQFDQSNSNLSPNATPLIQDESLLSLPALAESPISTLDLMG
jgi:hypothetical protein